MAIGSRQSTAPACRGDPSPFRPLSLLSPLSSLGCCRLCPGRPKRWRGQVDVIVAEISAAYRYCMDWLEQQLYCVSTVLAEKAEVEIVAVVDRHTGMPRVKVVG